MKTETMTRLSGLLTAMSLTVLIVGCGGGDGSELPYSTTPAVIDTPIATPPDNTTPDPTPPSDPTTVGNTTITWNAPSTRVDGTPIAMSELGGYYLYYGKSPDDISTVINIQDPYTFEITLNNLPSGKYYFRVSAFDTDGIEGPKSQTISKDV